MINYINYYPTYAVLDEICGKNNFSELNIFVDLKNCMQTTYMEHAVLNIIQNTISNGKMDCDIFRSVLSFLSFHKQYSNKRNIKINFYIFFETGQSMYHINIKKDYKYNRKIDNLYGLDHDKRELFYKILQSNYKLIEGVYNKIPNIKVIRLPFLEADFIPYYLISRNLINISDNTANVIYSNDHDLTQCLTCKNTYVFQRIGKNKKIISKGNIVFKELKNEISKNIPDEYLPFVMALNGDAGDNIAGIYGIGPGKIADNFNILNEMIGGNMDTLYNRIITRKDIFDIDKIQNGNKYINKIVDSENISKEISKNVRLISFELLSRECDDPNTTEMLDMVRYIKKILNNDNTIYTSKSIYDALAKIGIHFEDDQLSYLWT
jgi:hypothetical protein